MDKDFLRVKVSNIEESNKKGPRALAPLDHAPGIGPKWELEKAL